jgi:hypothetical protein
LPDVSNLFWGAKNRPKIKPLATRSYIDKTWIASSLRASQGRLQAALPIEKTRRRFPGAGFKIRATLVMCQ